MAKRGRKARPNALKLLAGVQPCRLNKAEVPVGAPLGEPPDWIDARGRELWESIRSAPWIGRSDALAVAILCEVHADLRACREIIARDGMLLTEVRTYRSMVRGETRRTVLKAHPLLPFMHACGRFLVKLCGELYLTPMSRKHLDPSRQLEPDALADFIKRRGHPARDDD